MCNANQNNCNCSITSQRVNNFTKYNWEIYTDVYPILFFSKLTFSVIKVPTGLRQRHLKSFAAFYNARTKDAVYLLLALQIDRLLIDSEWWERIARQHQGSRQFKSRETWALEVWEQAEVKTQVLVQESNKSRGKRMKSTVQQHGTSKKTWRESRVTAQYIKQRPSWGRFRKKKRMDRQYFTELVKNLKGVHYFSWKVALRRHQVFSDH